jgi:hypothetical protein
LKAFARITFLDFDGPLDGFSQAVLAFLQVATAPRQPVATDVQAEPATAAPEEKPLRQTRRRQSRTASPAHSENGQAERHEPDDQAGKPLVATRRGLRGAVLDRLRAEKRLTSAQVREMGAANPAGVFSGLMAAGLARLVSRGVYELIEEDGG